MTPAELLPTGLRAAGRRLWLAVVAGYELSGPELLLLAEACRTADTIAALQRSARGVVVADDGRVLPAVVELRLQRALLSKAVAGLRLPDAAGVRGVRRGPHGTRAPAELRSVGGSGRSA